jgi:hypothetical protein
MRLSTHLTWFRSRFQRFCRLRPALSAVECPQCVRDCTLPSFADYSHTIIRDLGTAEEIVRASSLDWTIARPPRLINKQDEAYRAVRDALPACGYSMSFRAVGAFMLDAVEHQTYLHEIVGLAT